MIKKHTMENIKQYFILFALTVSVMLLSCLSPVFNANLDDSSIFFTIGREMKHGAVVYKDVIDAKGLYIFLINMLASCISENNTYGIWIMTILSMFVCNIIILHIFKNCRKEFNFQVATITALIFDFVYCYTYIAYFSNKTEVYAAPALVYTIYVLMRLSRLSKIDTYKIYAFPLGIVLGYLINLKLTFILMPSALILMMLLELIYNKKFKLVAKTLLLGLVGFIIGNLPMLIYCCINNCFKEMVEYSILLNLRYVASENNLLVNFIVNWFTNKYGVDYCILLILLISSMTVLARSKNKWYRLTVYMVLIASILQVTAAGRLYYHYYIYVIPLLIPLIIKLAYIVYSRLADDKTFNCALLCIIIIIFGNIISTFQTTAQQRSLMNSTVEYYNQNYTDDTDTLFIGMFGEFHLQTGVEVDKHFSIQAVNYENYPDALNYKYELILNNNYDVIVYQKEYLKEAVGCYLRQDVQEFIDNNYVVVFKDSRGNIIYEKIK